MSCPYYRFKVGIFGGDYWCDKKDCRVNSDTYYKYCRNYDYTDCSIYKHTESTGCFITTIVCQLLGKSDNDEILNTLRNFRNNYLQKNKKFYPLLLEYDFVGPMISVCLAQENDKEIAKSVYQKSLKPISEMIKVGDYDNAISNYINMTNALKEYYSIKIDEIDYTSTKVEDPKLLGHGKKNFSY